MIDEKRNLPIGIFDSGVGGISVLKEALQLLPQETFIYYADSANAPYGTRSRDEILALSMNVANLLYAKGIKALLVACNTATSAAIITMRKTFRDIPVIGMEPAVKPAIEKYPGKKILVMATPLTLAEKKFADLAARFTGRADIISVPCPGLAELVESQPDNKEEFKRYLQTILTPELLHNACSIVLGCTHYIFVINEIRSIAGAEIEIIDGNFGTVHNLEAILKTKSLLHDTKEPSAIQDIFDRVELFTSADEKIIDICKKLLAQ